MTQGRIGGPMLKDNLVRNGIDLSFETDLLYFDVNNKRIGINQAIPTADLHVSGTSRFGNVQASGNTITSANSNGNITLSPNGLGNVILNTSTANRVIFSGTNKELLTNANLEFDGVTLSIATSNITLLRAGNLQFSDNEITTTNLNGNILLNPSGTGNVLVDTLTATRVLFAGPSKEITDSANLTFSGSTLSINGNVIATSSTSGNIEISNNNISSTNTNGNIVFSPNGTGNVVLDGAPSSLVFYSGPGGEIITDSELAFDGTYLHAGNLSIGVNTISSTNTNGNILLDPSGTGRAIFVGTNAITLPVGTSFERPIGQAGDLRMNSQIGSIEFFDGVTWQTIQAGASTIVSDNFNGDGSTTTFTLSQTSTTTGTIVSINGVVQSPSTAYTVSGYTLTMTEAPAVGDKIDARIIFSIYDVATNRIEGGSSQVTVASTTHANVIVTGSLVMSISNTAVIPGTNVTYDLGSSSYRWKDLYLSGSSLTLGSIVLKDSGGVLGVYQSDGTTPTNIGGNIKITNNEIQSTNVNGNINFVPNGSGNINANATIYTTNLISNVSTGTAPLTVTSTTRVANLNVASAGQLVNGTSNVNIGSSNGNVTVSVAGNANVLVVTDTGANIAGTANITGNANVGNLGSSGQIIATGNVSGGNVIASTLTSNVSTGTAPLTVTSTTRVANLNVASAGQLINGTSNVVAALSGNVTVSVAGQTDVLTITSTGANISGTANITGNANVGNLGTLGQIIATGNITGGNVIASTLTSNVSTGTAPLTVTSTTRVANLNVAAAGVANTVNDSSQPNITSLGTLSSLTTSGDVIVGGNLTVNGTTTTINATELTIDDLNIVLASGAASAAAANGAGITVDGAGANLIYVSTSNSWQFDRKMGANGTITATQLVSNIADGTAPLTVTSTTRVANLNVAAAGLANTVNDAAQPNITSVGNLTIANVDNIQINDNTISSTNANGNINLAPNGTGNVNLNANVQSTAVISGTRFISNIATGTAPFTVTSTTQVANLNVATAGSSTTAGTVTTAAQPNITSVGTLTGLDVNAVANATRFASNIATGTAPFTVVSTTQVANLNVATAGSLVNGTSNVTIVNNANVNISSAGNANVLVVTGSGANVAGTITSTGIISDGIGNLRSIPQNSQTVAYVLAATDNGKHVSSNTTVTVPNTVFSSGQVISVYNNSAANISIVQDAGVTMYLAGTATTGNRTLTQRGVATVLCVAANTFVISGAGLT